MNRVASVATAADTWYSYAISAGDKSQARAD